MVTTFKFAKRKKMIILKTDKKYIADIQNLFPMTAFAVDKIVTVFIDDTKKNRDNLDIFLSYIVDWSDV